MIPHYWPEAKAHLSAVCPEMKRIIASYPGELMQRGNTAFVTLLRAITGQQISVKAADAVWAKLEVKIKPMTPEKLLRMRVKTLRACGFSGQKVEYARNLAAYFVERQNMDFTVLSDDEVVAELTSIKGIGRWTAEMFLMFHLHRPDVFPLQDLGLIKAIELYYANGRKLNKNELLAQGEVWRPYRTVATWYLWRALDPVPVAY